MTRMQAGTALIDIFDFRSTDDSPWAIFCHGFPGAIGPLPAVMLCKELGIGVLFPQFPGEYDNAGEFSPEAAIASISDVLQDSKVPSPSLLLAHSFGAYTALRALPRIKVSTVERVLLLAPVTSYSRSPDAGLREDLPSHVRETREEHPFTYRLAPDNIWKRHAGSHVSYISIEPGWQGNVLTIFGDADDTFDAETFENVNDRVIRELTGCKSSRTVKVQGAGHGMDELIRDRPLIDSFLTGTDR